MERNHQKRQNTINFKSQEQEFETIGFQSRKCTSEDDKLKEKGV
jgi:hypothetical protein